MKMRLARAQHKNAKQQSGNADDKLLGEFAEGMYLLVYKCAAKHNEYNIRNIHNSVLEMNDGNIQYIITGDWLAQHCIFGRGVLSIYKEVFNTVSTELFKYVGLLSKSGYITKIKRITGSCAQTTVI